MPVPVDRALVGYVDSPVSPTDDPSRLGTVSLVGADAYTVRESVEIRLVHTVGHHGLDDRGAVKVVMRFPADGGAWQFDDPRAPNHVTAHASRPCGFRMRFEAFGHARPWFKVLTVQVVEGCLREGDQVVLVLGDRSGGGPGLVLQTFCEHAWELRFLVDPCATGHFVEVPGELAVAIGPDVPAATRLVGPTRWPVGAPFRLGVICLDRWGNPTDRAHADLTFASSSPVDGLGTATLRAGRFGARLDGCVAREQGILEIVASTGDGPVARWSMRITAASDEVRSWWGDLHGQSGETVGINTARDYFAFARDRAFLDATSHQGNAFQISGAFWAQLNALTAEFDQPGRFVALPGYEWSGNTAVGGDRNVYFREEGRPIRRSSHALLLERHDVHTDCTTAADLFAALVEEDAVAYAHVGGRWADLTQAHDGRVERAIEIHSAWGTFEWLAHDAFALGHRVGIVANSDGHKGRPGLSFPGAATFGAMGGLTCFLAPALTRDDLFGAIRARRTYATTGTRLDLAVDLTLPEPGLRYDDDPRLGPTEAHRTATATMGDIVETTASEVTVAVSVLAQAPLDHVEVRVGPRVVHRWRPPVEPGDARRVRVQWEGARYRGRGRQATWDGSLRLHGARIAHCVRVNAWNPDHAFTVGDHDASWEAVTTGNLGGLDLWLDEVEPDARLQVTTASGALEATVVSLDLDGVCTDCGRLGLALSARRLPLEAPSRVDLTCSVALRDGDSPIWVCVTLIDGHQAWSSPIHVSRDSADSAPHS